MKKNTAVLYSITPRVDYEGRIVRTLTEQGRFKGMMVPVNSELAAKEFGFDENISHRFFCKASSPMLVAGNILRYNGRDYSIVHVADYDKVKVVHLNTLVGRSNVRSVVQSLRY